MADVLLGLLLLLAFAAAIYVLARHVGLGRCLECRRRCAPWSDYCWRCIETRDVD